MKEVIEKKGMSRQQINLLFEPIQNRKTRR
jgi:hypothetical protein